MSIPRMLACCCLLLSGCVYSAREHVDSTVAQLVHESYDVAPSEPGSISSATPATQIVVASFGAHGAFEGGLKSPGDVATEIQPAAGTDEKTDSQTARAIGKGFKFQVPEEIPGSETPSLPYLPLEQAPFEREAAKIFPPLPPLPDDPNAVPSPNGRPYTLADFQQIAAANDPELRQAAAFIESEQGRLIQARAYRNPTVGWQMSNSIDAGSPSLQGPFLDQRVKTGGKLRLASAAAEMDLRNAELNVRRVRSELATRVRRAYFELLVARQEMVVNRALSNFTDALFFQHFQLLRAGEATAYEPLALRGQAYAARLAHAQSIANYIYAWKQLVATIGLRQLPLSQVEGRIDRLIPFYDYDRVLGQVLDRHTDMLTARNGIDKAHYQLKLAQIACLPDVDINLTLQQDVASAPKQTSPMATIGLRSFPLWDQKQGEVIAAESALVRATEEPHRVHLKLTGQLAAAYARYQSNMRAVDDYRHHVLPDQVLALRGALLRRRLDAKVAFADVMGAQQTLTASVRLYVGVLGSLWLAVVDIADLLQTDDLFQLAESREIPGIEQLVPWPCCHTGACDAVLSGSTRPTSTVPENTVPERTPLARGSETEAAHVAPHAPAD